MNELKALLKYFSIKELVAIGNFKKQFPDKTNEELYEILKERNPELYAKVEKIKQSTK